MTFLNSILNGNTLIRPAIRSPNFISGVSGWTINVDGSAEFNNLTIRGSFSTGTTSVPRITIDSTGLYPTIWFYSNSVVPGSDVPFINSPGGGIGINTSSWATPVFSNSATVTVGPGASVIDVVPLTTAAFTPAAGEFLVVIVTAGANAVVPVTWQVTDSLNLSWNEWALSNTNTNSAPNNGTGCAIFTQPVVTGGQSRTITSTPSAVGSSIAAHQVQVYRVIPSSGSVIFSVGATGHGNVDNTAHITPTVLTNTEPFSLLFGAGADYFGGGAATSADLTAIAFNAGGNYEGIVGYKQLGSTLAAQTIDLNNGLGGTNGEWSWSALEVVVSTQIRTRIFLFGSGGGQGEIIRANDQTRYGAYWSINDTTWKCGYSVPGQNDTNLQITKSAINLTFTDTINFISQISIQDGLIFARPAFWQVSDGTFVYTSLNLTNGGTTYFSIIRTSDSARYGAYAQWDQNTWEGGWEHTGTTAKAFLKASALANHKAELSALDGSGNINQFYVDDGTTGARVVTSNYPFQIQIGTATMDTVGKSTNMSGNSNGMLLHGENGFGAATSVSLSYGATMASQVDNVIVLEVGSANCQWVQTGSGPTGWQANMNVNQGSTWDWIGIRR